jgi:hypothetical protein
VTVTGKWGDPTGNPEDDWPDDEPEFVRTTLRPWWSKAWVRGILFLILMAPIVVLAIVGNAPWFVWLIAAIGLSMLLFNDVVYQSDAMFRSLAYKDGEDIEQSSLSRYSTMGCGAFFWFLALIMSITMLSHPWHS